MKQQRSKARNIFLWIAQVLLAALFLFAGSLKTFQPIDDLATQMPLATQVPEAFVRFIGIVELLGAAGLILPSLLKIKPVLTPLAAAGLAIVMLLAALFHLAKGEANAVPMNIIVFLLALFIAWGRFKKNPIEGKQFTTFDQRRRYVN